METVQKGKGDILYYYVQCREPLPLSFPVFFPPSPRKESYERYVCATEPNALHTHQSDGGIIFCGISYQHEAAAAAAAGRVDIRVESPGGLHTYVRSVQRILPLDPLSQRSPLLVQRNRGGSFTTHRGGGR